MLNSTCFIITRNQKVLVLQKRHPAMFQLHKKLHLPCDCRPVALKRTRQVCQCSDLSRWWWRRSLVFSGVSLTSVQAEVSSSTSSSQCFVQMRVDDGSIFRDNKIIKGLIRIYFPHLVPCSAAVWRPGSSAAVMLCPAAAWEFLASS